MTSVSNKMTEMNVEEDNVERPTAAKVLTPPPKKKIIIIVAVVVAIVVVALIIGLAVGLSSSTDESCSASTGGNITERVKGYIDSGTCDTAAATCECEDDAIHYFEEFEYNGKRVLIFSQIPDHPAEQDALNPNPNKRCTKWQYVQLPLLAITADQTATESNMGTVGVALTGAVFFNYAASPTGDVAILQEGDSMDSCMGHSAEGGAYHYHSNIRCNTSAAATGSTDRAICKHLGYHLDGVPVYGLCNDKTGTPFTSCYKVKSGTTTSTVTTLYGDIESASLTSDYEYLQANFDANTCNLDSASGAKHPTTDVYSYFMTENFPWMPSFYKTSAGASAICNAN